MKYLYIVFLYNLTMQMLTILAIVAIVAAVGMAGTVTVMSLPQVAHAAKGGLPGPDANSQNVCFKGHTNLPGKC
jgi:hypothetical protein